MQVWTLWGRLDDIIIIGAERVDRVRGVASACMAILWRSAWALDGSLLAGSLAVASS